MPLPALTNIQMVEVNCQGLGSAFSCLTCSKRRATHDDLDLGTPVLGVGRVMLVCDFLLGSLAMLTAVRRKIYHRAQTVKPLYGNTCVYAGRRSIFRLADRSQTRVQLARPSTPATSFHLD